MNNELLVKIVKKYRLEVVRYLPSNAGYRNTSYPLLLANNNLINLIIYKREDGIVETVKRANKVGDFLAANGIQARTTYSNQILSIRQNPQQIACLYTYLPGKTIPWESYTMKHIKLLGKTMSDMHNVLRDLEIEGFKDINNILVNQTIKLEAYFSDDGVKSALKEKLKINVNINFNIFRDAFKKINSQDTTQVLHMDFVRGNILFSDNEEPEITGILDFEKTSTGNVLFDISRTLAFLIVDCKYKDKTKIFKYFIKSGYNKYGKSSFEDTNILIQGKKISATKLLTSYFLLHDLYKFLKYNPYEYLYLNEHYIRTKQTLVNYGVIKIT